MATACAAAGPFYPSRSAVDATAGGLQWAVEVTKPGLSQGESRRGKEGVMWRAREVMDVVGEWLGEAASEGSVLRGDEEGGKAPGGREGVKDGMWVKGVTGHSVSGKGGEGGERSE